MATPYYDALNFTQRLAVRRAVFDAHPLEQLTAQPGMLQKQLEAIARNETAVERAVNDYARQRQQEARTAADSMRRSY